jgi:hypothetical protein
MSSTARSNRELYASPWYVFYSSFAATIDLLAAGPGRLAQEKGQPCRRIKVFSNGNLTVTRPDGTNITIIGVVGGDTLDIQATAIVMGTTTITGALVHW